jgi:hypothetical protein
VEIELFLPIHARRVSYQIGGVTGTPGPRRGSDGSRASRAHVS